MPDISEVFGWPIQVIFFLSVHTFFQAFKTSYVAEERPLEPDEIACHV